MSLRGGGEATKVPTVAATSSFRSQGSIEEGDA